MMTKKNYESAVKIIQSRWLEDEVNSIEWLHVVNTFVEFFQRDNMRFDPAVFRLACKTYKK